MTVENNPLRELLMRFKYKADKRDKWTLLDGENFSGDCEDFSLTVLWLMAGRSWVRVWWLVLTFQAMIWHTRVSSGGHAMLWMRGHGWIDNIYPQWSEKPRHRRVFPYLAPIMAVSMLIKR